MAQENDLGPSPAKRPRPRSQERHTKRRRADRLLLSPEARTTLERHFQHRLRITRPLSGTKLSSNDYHLTQRVATLKGPGICLFKRYHPETGTYRLTWARCQFALCAKATVDVRHVDGCFGFDPSGTLLRSATARLLMRCSCPVYHAIREYVWMVDPKDRRVAWKGMVVVHGAKHEPLAEGDIERDVTEEGMGLWD